MPSKDIMGIIILFLAYGLTWFLFFRSLRIVNLISKEKLQNLTKLRKRLKSNNPTIKSDVDKK